jgi:hypothetical protein
MRAFGKSALKLKRTLKQIQARASSTDAAKLLSLPPKVNIFQAFPPEKW